jgi:dTDP-4-dehydrorhamnose reductase
MAIQRIFITGANGMLGTQLCAYLRAKGYQVTGVGSGQFNLLHPIETLRTQLAMAINKDGTQKMALLAKELNCLFALISTDYVFNGQQQHPYKTTDKPAPLGVYGLSKYYAELIVGELLDDYYIIRTGWLYGLHGRNFVQFILEALRQGRELSIIDDQVGGPTWVGSLCAQIEAVISPSGFGGQFGLYHAVDAGSVSRYQQALTIAKVAGLSPHHISPISSDRFPQAARRPAYSVLDHEALPAANWETSLHAYFEQYRSRYLEPHA